MNRLPQRISLVSQTASVILEEIEAGRWVGTLPGEHDLVAQLHVGRRTVRSALSQLERQGVVRCARGMRREIIKKDSAANSLPTNNLVVVLTPEPLQALNPFVIFLVDQIRDHLTKAGYVVELRSSSVPYRARGTQWLESMAGALHPAGWILFGPTKPMQGWFAGRNLPCVIVGSCFDGVELPSVDRDFAAVAHHAVGQFVLRGHKRLALLTPTPAMAGDLVTIAAFGVAATRAGVTGIVKEHDGQVSTICSRVDRLLALSEPPTAFLISSARFTLTVLSHLLDKGLCVPRDVALISRDDDNFLEMVVPSVARYSHSVEPFAAQVSRILLQSLSGSANAKQYRITPDLIKGRTLG